MQPPPADAAPAPTAVPSRTDAAALSLLPDGCRRTGTTPEATIDLRREAGQTSSRRGHSVRVRSRTLELNCCDNEATCPPVTDQDEARWQARPWGAPDDDDARAACHGLRPLDRPARPRRGARAGQRHRGRDRHRHALPGRGGAALQEAGLLALRRPHLPDARPVGRHAPAYRELAGRRRLRQHASAPSPPTASPAARRWSRPPASRSSSAARSTSWSSPTTPRGSGSTEEIKTGNPSLMADPTLAGGTS